MTTSDIIEALSVIEKLYVPRVQWKAAPGVDAQAVIAQQAKRDAYRRRYNSKGRALARRYGGKRA